MDQNTPEVLKFALEEIALSAHRDGSDSVGRCEFFARAMPEHADTLRTEAAGQYFQKMAEASPGRTLAVLVLALVEGIASVVS